MLSDEEIVERCRPFTLTSRERLLQSLAMIEHVINNNIEGDIIEVGVWRGGNVMAFLLKLIQMGKTDRHVHLYDTFQGMTEASDKDVNPEGISAKYLIEHVPFFRCIADIDDVKKNIKTTEYPENFLHFHVGDIRQVKYIPEKIACLRLDIDWYELYNFCLGVFEPKVQPGGTITIDDYGYWRGCKEAVDGFLEGSKELIKIDDTGVYWIKSK